MKNGFTLIELLIVLSLVGCLIAFSIFGTAGFRNSLEYSNSVNQILSDIKLTQQLANTSSQTCRIDFDPASNAYSISKAGKLYRKATAGKNVRFSGKSYFEFLASGSTGVGGSGTLVIGGSSRPKKVIVSQRGRIRVE
jgi:prepilin-type N-terminal cleavage/methylation domain-containing protein